jgi:hypothetical protein
MRLVFEAGGSCSAPDAPAAIAESVAITVILVAADNREKKMSPVYIKRNEKSSDER